MLPLLRFLATPIVFLVVIGSTACTAPSSSTQSLSGLEAAVDIYRDQWGVNHIYAQNQNDLFFAQGYAAAKDRLFQFEIWRRQATGTTAEILGPQEIERDYGTRLFRFRGDMTSEMQHYHPEGVAIITAFVAGVNAYIAEINATPEALPLPFKALGIQPQPWTPEVVISRHQGLLGNIGQELQIARAVALLGPEKVKDLLWLHPQSPNLKLHQSIPKALLFEDLLAPYYAFRRPVQFKATHIQPKYRTANTLAQLNAVSPKRVSDSLHLGSNNWVISGSKMNSGQPFMANDPHRSLAVPSLRYMAHLNAPGWNVIGGGEPEIPGISIGHNEYGAWGLTVFRTDGEDMLVYRLHPKDPERYWYKGQWVPFETEKTTIKVKGEAAITRVLRYTVHGPVTFVDAKSQRAVAVRCAWQEVGGAPYLASLRMDQATDWDSFRAACNYSNIPGENMIWADTKGNIGWQAVGIAPIRTKSSGLVPVPGDGSYDWDGYLPIVDKPNAYNPEKGFIATANQNVTPEDYTHWDAIGYSWSDPFRGDRIDEVLQNGEGFDMEAMRKLQVDYTSLPARKLVPLVLNLQFEGLPERAQKSLQNWNFELQPNSQGAAIYAAFEKQLLERAQQKFVPKQAQEYIRSLQLKRVLDWVEAPTVDRFGVNPNAQRDAFLVQCFEAAVADLKTRLGADLTAWTYGSPYFKHVAITHALGTVVADSLQQRLNMPQRPRGGNAYTPGSTGSNDRQSSGATFRMLVDLADWDSTLGTNSPGQSGDPDSPFYSNLYEDWAKDVYFPMYFSLEKIKANSHSHLQLVPKE